MKNLILASVLLFSIPVIGQKDYIGVKGGVSWTNIFVNGSSGAGDYRSGFTGGLTYTHAFKNNFRVGLDLLFAQRGYSDEFVFSDNTGNSFGKFTVFSNYEYLSLPIKAGYSIGNRFEGFLNLGVVPALLTKAETKFPNIIAGGGDENVVDQRDQVKNFDLGGIIELGGEYHLQEHFLLFTSVAYQQSFTSFNKNQTLGQKGNHYGMIISLGIKYAL